MAFPRPQVTAVGRALLTKVMDGEPLEFTRIKMGSGSLTDVSADRLTNLVYTEASIEISQILRGDDYVSIRGIFSNEDVTTGFYWREVGLFAKDPVIGEVLFAYANAGSIADYISPATASEIVRTVVMVVSISNASQITLVVDESLTYATWEDLQDLAESVRKSFENVNNKFTNITNIIQQVTGVDPDDPNAAPDGSMVVTLTHEKSGTVHTFTGLGERTGLVPCQFKSTAGYTEGDTATIDGTAYTITLTSADAPETDLFVSGKSILVDVDTESKTINFKSGGGLTKAKLALADATEDTVFNGRTFYARDKTMRTGRALATPTTVDASKMFTGVTAYNQQGQMITGAPPATTAVESDVKSGKTYYDDNGVLKTGNKPDAGTFISSSTSSRLTIGGSNGTYKDVTFQVPPNANLAVIELEAIGNYDPTMLALVFNIKGTPKKWEGTKMIITHYGSGGASYNTVSNLEILNGGSTLKFRCNALRVSSSYSVLNVAHVSFYT